METYLCRHGYPALFGLSILASTLLPLGSEWLLVLLLFWLPIIGAPLCLAAGLFKVPWPEFILLVSAGKLARYAAVAWLLSQGEAPAA